MWEALEIAKTDHASGFEEAISFMEFAKTMCKIGEKIIPIPKRFKISKKRKSHEPNKNVQIC